MTRNVWKCDRCGHEWLSRDEGTPIRCAKCKSPYWNKPRNSTKNRIKEPKLKKVTLK